MAVMPALFTVAEYERLLLPDGRRFELLDGVIVETSPKNDAHIHAVEVLNERFSARAQRDGYRVLVQDPVVLQTSMPEPDIVLARRSSRGRRPHADDVLLAIEVSDTTLAKDRRKLDIFLREGIVEVWIVDLVRRSVTRYRGNMAPQTVSSGTMAPVAVPSATITVEELFL